MPNLPKSLLAFVMTAVVYLLQAFPLTGIILMMLAAPFWSVILINLGFIGIGVEALSGQVPRRWLLLPLAWFSGYAAFALVSHRAIDQLDAEIRRHNAGKTLLFSSSDTAIVIEQQNNASSGITTAFIREYDIPVVYETNRNYKTASHTSHRIVAQDQCTTIRNDPSFNQAGIHSLGFHEGRTFIKDLCQVSAPEDPAKPAVTINIKTTKSSTLRPTQTLQTIYIKNSTGTMVDLRSGYGAPLSWIPMPILGCALNSGAPSWDCFHFFGRESMRGLGAQGAYGAANIPIVAAAIGLKRSFASERKPTILAQTPHDFNHAILDRSEISLKNLDQIIANPVQRFNIHDVAGLQSRPDLLRSRADAMATAFVAALDTGDKARESVIVLRDLLPLLSVADFERVGPKIVAALDVRQKIGPAMIGNALPVRLGDLGRLAVPLLERIAFPDQERPNGYAILGLCRIGANATQFSKRIADILQKTKRSNSEIHSAAYVTLLRLGRPDLADLDSDADSRYQRKHYDNWRQTVTPESPPDVCLTSDNQPYQLRPTQIAR